MYVECDCGKVTNRPEKICRDCYEQKIRVETLDMFPDVKAGLEFEAANKKYKRGDNATSREEDR